tara:strand:- start:150 stop:362 length:213 start_codon:yes stop_codon:yes gene_type:complete
MSLSKSKNFERKLNLISKEATTQLNNVCGSNLWETLGFICFDQLDNKDKIAKANFYYGQLQLVKELKSFY